MRCGSFICFTLVAQPAERRFHKAFSSEDYIFSFRKWLIAQDKRYWTVRKIVIFAKKYGHVLDNGDASELLTLSSSNRKHALSALAALSKYHGRYDQYLQLKQRYSLRWTSTSSVQSLQRFFNPDLTFHVMLSKVNEMIQALPEPMALVIKHAVLTGLRPAEAVESVRLQDDISSIRSGRQQQMYYNPERQTLERCDLSS